MEHGMPKYMSNISPVNINPPAPASYYPTAVQPVYYDNMPAPSAPLVAPYYCHAPRPFYGLPWAVILVLFILLVIITRPCGCKLSHGKK